MMHSRTATTADGAGRPSAGLSRRQRMTLSGHFGEAFRQDRCFRGRLTLMWLRSAPDAALRLGVVTTKKLGNAVVRARARRLMREAYRLNRFRFEGAFDVVLLARRGIVGAARRDVEAELLQLARKAGLLRKGA